MTATFFPLLFYITDVTKELNAMFTFSEDHDFTPGEYVSFRSSSLYGMVEINNKRALVLSTTDDTITTDLDSSNFSTFIPQSANLVQIPAVAVPAGSGILPASYPATVSLIDRFDHIPD